MSKSWSIIDNSVFCRFCRDLDNKFICYHDDVKDNTICCYDICPIRSLKQ